MTLHRRVTLALSACALLAPIAALAQTDGDGRQRWIDVNNNASVQIREVYLTDTGTRGWGDDRLGRATIEPGGYYRLYPNAAQAARRTCQYDLRLVFANNRSFERRDFNLCQATRVDCDNRGCSVR